MFKSYIEVKCIVRPNLMNKWKMATNIYNYWCQVKKLNGYTFSLQVVRAICLLRDMGTQLGGWCNVGHSRPGEYNQHLWQQAKMKKHLIRDHVEYIYKVMFHHLLVASDEWCKIRNYNMVYYCTMKPYIKASNNRLTWGNTYWALVNNLGCKLSPCRVVITLRG